jgi:hypothetical protein
MKFKEFRKTKERMSVSAFAQRAGLSIDNYECKELFVYLEGFVVEIHHEIGSDGIEIENELVYTTFTEKNGECESTKLKDIERQLYKGLVKDGAIKLEEKKEKIDPKMPLGLDSYLDTFYQISSFIGFQSDRYIRGKMVLKANDSVRKFTDELTSYEQGNEVKKMATELEQRIYKLDNSEDGVEYDHLEEIDKFCAEKFPSKGFIEVIHSMSDTEYEVSSYMGANRNSPLFESLDGTDGQHRKAIELSKEFDLKFKDATWGENGIGSFYEMIDEFLKETFYPKKTYRVISTRSIDCMAEVEATSIEEAQKLVANLTTDQYSDLGGSDDWQDGEVKEV